MIKHEMILNNKKLKEKLKLKHYIIFNIFEIRRLVVKDKYIK